MAVASRVVASKAVASKVTRDLSPFSGRYNMFATPFNGASPLLNIIWGKASSERVFSEGFYPLTETIKMFSDVFEVNTLTIDLLLVDVL